MSDINAAPPHEITIEVDGAPFTVFMSFSLLNRICYLMGSDQQIPLILQDPEMREAILVECLAIRDGKGKVVTRRGIDEVSMSFTHIQDVLEFVTGHVVDFSTAALERANKVMSTRKPRLDALLQAATQSPSTATSTGQENSASKMPAA